MIEDNNNPTWNVEYCWPVEEPGDIELSCWDFNDDRPHTRIGAASVPMNNFMDQKPHEFWIRFYLNDEITGRVHIKAHWVWSRVLLYESDLTKIHSEIKKNNDKTGVIQIKLTDVTERYRILYEKIYGVSLQEKVEEDEEIQLEEETVQQTKEEE